MEIILKDSLQELMKRDGHTDIVLNTVSFDT